MERIGNEVHRTLARSGGEQGTALAAVTAAWPAAVGDAIARNAWPRRLAGDGTLHVATASATWAQELGFLADEIVSRLGARLGPDAPTALRCAPGPIPEPERLETEPSPRSPSPAEAPPEVRREADSVAAAIDDPELRELVARAARASLLRARSGRNF